jgi:hypothetical protein
MAEAGPRRLAAPALVQLVVSGAVGVAAWIVGFAAGTVAGFVVAVLAPAVSGRVLGADGSSVVRWAMTLLGVVVAVGVMLLAAFGYSS